MKYVVSYLVSGEVIVEAESAEAAKEIVRERLPTLVNDNYTMINAKELEVLE